MQANRQVRVIKRNQRGGEGGNAASRAAATVAIEERRDGAAAERDVRAVVSGWVREHREGVEDYRRALSTLFARLDSSATRAA